MALADGSGATLYARVYLMIKITEIETKLNRSPLTISAQAPSRNNGDVHISLGLFATDSLHWTELVKLVCDCFNGGLFDGVDATTSQADDIKRKA